MEDYNELGGELRKAAGKLTNHADPRGTRIESFDLIQPGGELVIDLPGGNRAVSQLEIKLKPAGNYPEAIRSVVLMGEFDGEQTIWVPAGDFFNNVGKLRPHDMLYRSVHEDSAMVSRWVMPYKSKGSIRLKNFGQSAVEAELKVTVSKWKWDDRSMYFHATWRMDDPYSTFPIFDWNFLEAEGRGVIAGDEWTVLNPAEGWWGEGDEKIWVDDDFEKNFPSHFGTGTEDYYGWAGGVVPTPENEFAKPFHGNIIVGDPNSMGYNLSSRERSLDAIPFNSKIKFDMEASCGIRSASFFLQYSQTTFWYAFPGVKHNRQPLPVMAGRQLPTLEKLQQQVAEARSKQFAAEGAVEAEIFRISAKSNGVKENREKIEVWGEISNGDMKNLLFEKPGDFAEIKITEQFRKAGLKLCATVGPASGIFDIYVNGIKKVTQNFNTGHSGMTTPLISLGEAEPVDNAFLVRFEYKGRGNEAKPGNEKSVLGIDYFLIGKD